jgi:hypothetical protein
MSVLATGSVMLLQCGKGKPPWVKPPSVMLTVYDVT